MLQINENKTPWKQIAQLVKKIGDEQWKMYDDGEKYAAAIKKLTGKLVDALKKT